MSAGQWINGRSEDGSGDSLDVTNPATGEVIDTVTLATADGPRTEPQLVELVRELAVQHRSYWRKGAAEPAAAAELLGLIGGEPG